MQAAKLQKNHQKSKTPQEIFIIAYRKVLEKQSSRNFGVKGKTHEGVLRVDPRFARAPFFIGVTQRSPFGRLSLSCSHHINLG